MHVAQTIPTVGVPFWKKHIPTSDICASANLEFLLSPCCLLWLLFSTYDEYAVRWRILASPSNVFISTSLLRAGVLCHSSSWKNAPLFLPWIVCLASNSLPRHMLCTQCVNEAVGRTAVTCACLKAYQGSVVKFVPDGGANGEISWKKATLQ